MNLGGSAEQNKYVESGGIPVCHVKSMVLSKSYGDHKSIGAQQSKLATAAGSIANWSFLSSEDVRWRKEGKDNN